MNKISKSSIVPASLSRGISLVTNLEKEVKVGKKDLTFDRSVYAASDVKEQLKEDQKGKCAYCERFLNGDYGAVEHFRPKGGYCLNGKLERPGYYWLAYDWNNLLFSCSECNTSYKGNHFPLEDENMRDIASQDISKEKALLIQPVVENPGDFIAFHKHIVVAKNGNLKGKTTIALLKLNDRKDLKEKRERRWEDYEKLVLMKEIALKMNHSELLSLVQSQMLKLTSESNEFTGMFKYQK